MSPLPHTATCMNPECGQSCRYDPSHRGQKPHFCSPACRREYHMVRNKLQRRIEILTDYLTTDAIDPFSREAEKTRSDIAHAKWLLVRYGGLSATN